MNAHKKGPILKDYLFISKVAIDNIVEDGHLSQNMIQQLIHSYNILLNYMIFLRLVKKQLHYADGYKREKLFGMKNILEEKGGKPLNLYSGDNS